MGAIIRAQHDFLSSESKTNIKFWVLVISKYELMLSDEKDMDKIHHEGLPSPFHSTTFILTFHWKHRNEESQINEQWSNNTCCTHQTTKKKRRKKK